MINYLFTIVCALFFTSCSSYVVRNSATSSQTMTKNYENTRLIASSENEQIFSKSSEIEEFLNQNTCSIKGIESKTGVLIYERNLNSEIEEGKKESSFGFLKKIYIQTAKNENGHEFGYIFIAYPAKDTWYGEEVFVSFEFDKNRGMYEDTARHKLFISTTSPAFELNPIIWNDQPTLTGVDFEFSLKNRKRKFVLRCDPKAN